MNRTSSGTGATCSSSRGSSSIIWDLQSNTTRSIAAPGNSRFFHMPALRGYFMTTDVNTGSRKTPLWRIDPSTANQNAQVSTLGGYSPDAHAAGQWVQEDATLPGGDRPGPWFLRSSFDMSYAAYGNGAKEALAFIRADGSDFRLLAHHYSSFSGSLPADRSATGRCPRAPSAPTASWSCSTPTCWRPPPPATTSSSSRSPFAERA